MTTAIENSTSYQKAASLLKVQAILAIVFGSIGIVFGILLTFLFFIASGLGEVTESESIEFFVYGALMPFLYIIPHIYLVISGSFLLRSPSPKLAKVLTVVNIVFGALWNLILLVFAVLYIAQSSDYERGYKAKK